MPSRSCIQVGVPPGGGQLVDTIIEIVYVDLEAKYVVGLRLAPAFRALLGKAIETAPDAPVLLTHSVERELFGVGGDGGELNLA